MPPTTTAGFRLFLKSAPNMKLSSDSAVLRVLYEGLTTYTSFADFDDDSIKTMAKNCKETIPAVAADAAAGIAAENEVPGVIVSTQSIVRLQLACKAVKYYISVSRVPTAAMLHYDNILTVFKIEYEAYEKLQKEDAPKVPTVADSDNDRKIIKWAPAFLDCMSRTFGIKGPLAYVNNYVKKASGLKHVMSVLAKEETGNSAFVATLNSIAPPATQPAPGTVMQVPVPTPSVGAAAVTVPPSPAVAPPTQPQAQDPNASALTHAFPGSATRMTLNSILKPSSGKKGGGK